MKRPPIGIEHLRLGIRFVLGCIFLFSSFAKIADPSAFAAIVANYQMLPQSGVTASAVVFPWIEAVCGLALVFGRFELGAALLIALMMIVFTVIGFYNAYRGLNIACGCFSLSATEPSSIAVNTLRNLAILAAGAWILNRSRRQGTVEVR